MSDYYWAALYVKSRTEKKVAKRLAEIGIDYFLPTVKTKVQWSDRLKTIEKVLISGYVFVYISEKEYYDVLNIHGAVSYVRTGGKAARIRKEQIDSMKLLLGGDALPNLEDVSSLKGQIVEITHGVFKGFAGEVLETKTGNKLVVRIEQIGFCVSLEVSSACITL